MHLAQDKNEHEWVSYIQETDANQIISNNEGSCLKSKHEATSVTL